MGIRIDGASDLINATDGSLTIEGQSLNTTGIITASGGMKVGSAATIHSTGQFNIGVAATVFPNGNATFAGIATVASLVSSGAISGTTGTFSGNINANGNIVGDNSTDISGINDVTISMLSISDTITHTGDTNTKIRFPSADTITAETGGSERARIDSAGRILQGTTAYKSNLNSSADTSGQLAQFIGKTDDVNHCLGVFAYSGTSNPTVRGAKIQLNRARSTDGTTNTALADNDLIGTIEWKGNDGTNFTQASKIECFVDDSSVGADDMGGTLVFSTTSEGAHTSSERARIDSSGNTNFGAVKAVAFPSGTGIQVYHSANPRIKLTNDTTGNAGTDGTQLYLSSSDFILDNKDSGSIVFHTNASEKVKITSSGDMMINQPAEAAGRICIKGTNNSGSTCYSTGGSANAGKALEGYDATCTTVGDGNYGGAISFGCGGNGRSAIAAHQVGGDDDINGLAFFVHESASGTDDNVEKMRINPNGSVLCQYNTNTNLKTHIFSHAGGAGGSGLTTTLATFSTGSAGTTIFAEIDCIGTYGSGNTYVHASKWITALRAVSNSPQSWSANTPQEVGANGHGDADVDIQWVDTGAGESPKLQAVVGAWCGFTVTVKLHAYKGEASGNSLVAINAI